MKNPGETRPQNRTFCTNHALGHKLRRHTSQHRRNLVGRPWRAEVQPRRRREERTTVLWSRPRYPRHGDGTSSSIWRRLTGSQRSDRHYCARGATSQLEPLRCRHLSCPRIADRRLWALLGAYAIGCLWPHSRTLRARRLSRPKLTQLVR